MKAQDARFARLRVLVLALGCLSFLPLPATAATVALGTSGWQASWDGTLDPFVGVTADSVTTTTVFIEITKEFTQAPGPGGIPPIPITFTQVDVNAVGQIAINDEIITNSTGVDWTDYHWELLDGGDAVFNPFLTNASAGGDGFATDPFNNQAFGLGNLAFWADGFGLGPGGTDAIVPDGGFYFPGDGAFDGELYIDVVTGDGSPEDPFTTFTLKQFPTFAPEPSALSLLAVGFVGLLIRRR